MRFVTVTDENGNDFPGLTDHVPTDSEQKVPVWAFIDGENCFGKNTGEVSLLHLKQLSNGKFGA
jgi:hypothetical protein